MEVLGKVKVVGAVQQVSASFVKRELVVTTDEQYPQSIMIEFVQDKADLLNAVSVGDNVKVSINLGGREWVNPQGETKYFNSVNLKRSRATTSKLLRFCVFINLIVYRYLKTFIIMANYDLKFIDCFRDTTINAKKNSLELYSKNKEVITIVIQEPKTLEQFNIHLDKSTAIKFAKTLRTEINKITESEVNNG
jgi:hypothetical protein